jgi:hypothetical protein
VLEGVDGEDGEGVPQRRRHTRTRRQPLRVPRTLPSASRAVSRRARRITPRPKAAGGRGEDGDLGIGGGG